MARRVSARGSCGRSRIAASASRRASSKRPLPTRSSPRDAQRRVVLRREGALELVHELAEAAGELIAERHEARARRAGPERLVALLRRLGLEREELGLALELGVVLQVRWRLALPERL